MSSPPEATALRVLVAIKKRQPEHNNSLHRTRRLISVGLFYGSQKDGRKVMRRCRREISYGAKRP